MKALLSVLLCFAPALCLGEDASGSGVPELVPWMFNGKMQKSDWLGIPFNRKKLYEPVNVLIADSFASSPDEAESRLLAACGKAGYRNRYGHSSDYSSYINGELARQFPSKKRHAFSDRPFEENNNHGRIFGPVLYGGKYWFSAAFSREKVVLKPKPEHKFVSFNQARDSFAWNLDAKTDYKVLRFIHSGNAIVGSPSECTGDHDGVIILLETIK